MAEAETPTTASGPQGEPGRAGPLHRFAALTDLISKSATGEMTEAIETSAEGLAEAGNWAVKAPQGRIATISSMTKIVRNQPMTAISRTVTLKSTS